MSPALPSLRRVRPGGVPLLHRYYGELRLPAAPPTSLRCLRSAVPARCPEAAGSPRFLRNPCVRAVVSDPGGVACAWLLQRRSDVAFRVRHGVGPHVDMLSWLNPKARALPVYASQRRLPSDHATLGSGWVPALTGQGFHLLGSTERFQRFVGVSPSLRLRLSQAAPTTSMPPSAPTGPSSWKRSGSKPGLRVSYVSRIHS
jgi:hypothetical protein